MARSLCGARISSRRALLALLWSVVSILTGLAFLTALVFALMARNFSNNDDDRGGEQRQDDNPEVAVTSRAMAFASLWTAVLACVMSLFGTVILGFQSPTGQYYTCCAGNVHRTTPLALGSFIGALLMFANLTLVCSVLFGEFEIRDYQREGGDRGGRDQGNDSAVGRSSMAFSIMCMFLTVLYAGFAALTYAFSASIVDENIADARAESLNPSQINLHHPHRRKPSHNFNNGYIGERFDVRPSVTSTNAGGFVAPNDSGLV